MDPWSDTLLDLPAGIVPAGHTPEFNTLSPQYPLGIAILVIALVISTTAVLIRCYAIFIRRKVQAPDVLVILAWAFQIPYGIFTMLVMQYGVGKHQYDVRIRDAISILYNIQNATIMYILMACLLKVAILLQYFQLFVVNKKKSLGIVIWATISIIIIFTITVIAFLIWQCDPRSKIWNPFVPGSCYSWLTIAESSGIFNVVSDFALLFIPIYPVCKLELSVKKKIQIIGIFAIGFIDCLASIGRTYYTWRLGDTTDQTYIVIYLGYWCWAELAFGFLVACLPASTLFVKTLRQKFSKIRHAEPHPYVDLEQRPPVFSGKTTLTSAEYQLGERVLMFSSERTRAHLTTRNDVEVTIDHPKGWNDNDWRGSNNI